MRIVWSKQALVRLKEIRDYISLDNPSAASRLIRHLFDNYPYSGRIVPEIGRRDIREVIKTGYRIIYRVRKKELAILTIRHCRQKFFKFAFPIPTFVRAKDILIKEPPPSGLVM